MRNFNFRRREFEISLPGVPKASCLENSFSSCKNCDVWTSCGSSRLKWGANQNHAHYSFLNVICPVVWESWTFSRKQTIFSLRGVRKTMRLIGDCDWLSWLESIYYVITLQMFTPICDQGVAPQLPSYAATSVVNIRGTEPPLPTFPRAPKVCGF